MIQGAGTGKREILHVEALRVLIPLFDREFFLAQTLVLLLKKQPLIHAIHG
jgi:hypothetical protein